MYAWLTIHIYIIHLQLPSSNSRRECLKKLILVHHLFKLFRKPVWVLGNSEVSGHSHQSVPSGLDTTWVTGSWCISPFVFSPSCCRLSAEQPPLSSWVRAVLRATTSLDTSRTSPGSFYIWPLPISQLTFGVFHSGLFFLVTIYPLITRALIHSHQGFVLKTPTVVSFLSCDF